LKRPTPAFIEHAAHAAWQSKGPVSTLLWPLSLVVRAVIARKRRRYQQHPELTYQSSLPVLVVGNIYLGGTGKTPVAIALIQALRTQGWRPGVVSRGYGVRLGDAPRTGRGKLDPRQFGDEPALISEITDTPIAVHPNRVHALQQLQHDYPDVDVIIADDGLQHLALGRDVEVVVQDARGVGNGMVLPAGPLREPPSRLQSVDFLITNMQAGLPDPAPLPVSARQITMRLQPTTVVHLVSGRQLDWEGWRVEHRGQTLNAAAAIGQPQRFFAMLEHAGAKLQTTLSLPDHDAYHSSPFDALPDAPILITSKDAVKCRRFDDPRLWVVHAAPQFSDPEWMSLASGMLRAAARRKAGMAPSAARH
jgi:tetraacyldisaccharide 4'-kinase